MNRLGLWAQLCVLAFLLIGITPGFGQAPVIVLQPQDQNANSGSSVSFSADATGPPPIRYQWQSNETNLVSATNALLTLTNLQIFQAGSYRVIVSNGSGAATSVVARLALDSQLVFRITGLVTNGFVAVEHEAVTGDDRGGIAVSANQVFCTGDDSTARWNIEYLTGATSLGTAYQGLVTDLRTATVYTLGNGASPLTGAGTITSLLQLDGNSGVLTGTRVNLSTNIVAPGGSGIFAGYGRVVIHTGSRAFSIAVPSGTVTDLGPMDTFSHSSSENWAYWGIAEFAGDSVYLVYVRDSQSIVRTRVPGGATTVLLNLPNFPNLSDMASISFSVAYSRWYFHVENTSIFRSGDETIGSAKAFYTTDPDLPFISRDPGSQNIFPGDSIQLSVGVTGASPLTYQWLREGTNLVGQTNSTLALGNVLPSVTGNYSVEVRNASGSALSGSAFVFVISTPEVLAGPFDISTFAGSNVTFVASSRSAPPRTFQWRYNGTNILGATNSSLSLASVQPSQSGLYSLQISNSYGTTVSRSAQLFVFAPQDDGSVFRVRNFLTNGFRAIDTYSLSRNQLQEGTLAVSASRVFFSSPPTTVRVNADDLSGGTEIGTVYHGMVSNLRTEQPYVLADDNGPLGSSGGTITRLLEVDPNTGGLNGRVVRLSVSVPAGFTTGQPGIFSGYGEMAVHNGSHTYLIYLPSGLVVDMGNLNAFQHAFSQGWAHYGIVEHIGGVRYLVYERDSQTIVRTRVPDGQTSTVNSFQNITFYLSLSVSVPRNRWYFHTLFNSQFGNNTQNLGYAPAEFEVALGENADHFDWAPIARLQQTNLPFIVTITAKTVAGATISNYSGALNLRGFNTVGGSAVSVSPATLTGFTNGSWTGPIRVLQTSAGMQLRVDDGTGAVGTSGDFFVTAANDLVVVVNDSPDPAVIGQEFNYSIFVTNTGPNAATAVVLTNGVPSSIIVQGVSTSVGSCLSSNGTIRCELGTLTSAGATINVRAIGAVLGIVTNRFGVTRGEADSSLANNSAIETTTITLPRLFIEDVNYVEGDSGTNDLTFIVTLNGPATNVVQVSYTTANGTAVGSGSARDFLVASGTVVFNPGSTSQPVVVRVRGDTVYEGDEFFLLQLFSPSGAVLADNEARATILNDDPAPAITLSELSSDVSVVEGNAGTTNAGFQVVLSGAPGVAIVATLVTSNGTATAGSDYIPQTNTLTFAAGSGILTQVFNVAVVGDTRPESNETFFVSLSAINATVVRAQATGRILNDDGVGFLDHFAWSSLPASLAPGVAFAVTLTAQDFFNSTLPGFSGSVSLQALAGQPQISRRILGDLVHTLSVADGSFTIGYEFTPTNNIRVTHFRHYAGTKVSLWRPDGALLATQAVNGPNGGWAETALASPVDLTAGQTYVLAYFGGGQGYYWNETALTNFPNGTIGTSRVGQGDDFPPADSGGGPVIFLVDLIYLTGATPLPLALNPVTSGSFSNGVWSGLLTIADAATNVFLRAQSDPQHFGQSSVFDIRLLQQDADLALTVNGPTQVSLGATITNSFVLQNLGPAAANDVVLSNVFPSGVTFVAANASQGTCSNTPSGLICRFGTLTSGAMATGIIAFKPGTAGNLTNRARVFYPNSDPVASNNVVVSTINVVQPVLTIRDTSVVEGDSGTNEVVFVVQLSIPSSETVEVSYTTANGTAVGSGANRDFFPKSGLLTFPPGTTNQTVVVLVRADTTLEQDETFLLQLFSPSNAIIGDNEGEARIINDDAPPTVAVRDTSVVEGATGVTNALFQVVLSAASGFTITVDYATSNNTALAGEDYVEQNGRLIFLPGATVRTQLVSIAVRGDRVGELDESFFLRLTASSNATISVASATGTILNDDVGGSASELVWDPISPFQYANRSFPIAIQARDAFGMVATNFAGPVAVSATSFGDVPGRTILGQVRHGITLGEGPSTDAYTFTPRTNLLVTHFRHYSGDKVSLWNDQGIPLVVQPVSSVPGTWVETPLLRPVQLLAGTRYRLGVFAASGHNFGRVDLPPERADVVLNQSYSAVGDSYLQQSNAVRWPFIDLVYTPGTATNLVVTLNASGGFTNGTWAGQVSLAQPARYVVLQATDTHDVTGSSTVFEVAVSNDLRVVATVLADLAVVGQPFTYRVQVQNTGPASATGVILTNLLPAGVSFLSATSTVGGVSQAGSLVTWNIGTLSGGDFAIMTFDVIANISGATLLSRSGVFGDAPDLVPDNNSAIVSIATISPIVNRGFETGDFTGWVVQDLSSTYLPMLVRADGFSPGFALFATLATEGSRAATHGFMGGNPGMIRIAQDVFVPRSLSVLSFDYRIGWILFGGSTESSFDVRVEPRGGGTPLLVSNLLTVLPLTENPDTGPLSGLIDLSAYAGGSVRISFDWTIREPFAGPGFVQLDNVDFIRGEERPPVVVTQPQDRSVSSGSNVTFVVGVTGSQPLFFQWYFNETPVTRGTNGSLVVPSVSLFEAGRYQVVITNAFGVATSQVARLLVDADLLFRIVSLDTNGVRAVDHNNLTGDDRGGLAVSSSRVFINGDGNNNIPTTARYNIDDFTGGTSLGVGYDALISDLKTETVYSLGNGASLIQFSNSVLNFSTCNSLQELDTSTGLPTARRINLSSSIDISQVGSVGLFAGYGRIVIYNGQNAYNIALPSGLVTDLGSLAPFNHAFAETWAFWGIAEFFQDAVHLVYVQDGATIARRRIPDGVTSVILSVPFGDGLGDMAAITFSLSRSRWFFHHENSSILHLGGEIVGSAKASFTRDAGFPLITQLSPDLLLSAGDDLSLLVDATGSGSVHYQWFHDGRLLTGATSDRLRVNGVGKSDEGSYQVEISNELGFLRSPPISVTILSVPTIIDSPDSISVFAGTNVIFSVVALGAQPLQYQWRLGNQEIPGATNSTLTLTNVHLVDSGTYSVVVSNQFGSEVSPDATLNVIQIVDDGSVFRITSLQTNAPIVIDHEALTGDDRGGVVSSSTHVFVTGDNRTARFALADLSGGAVIGTVAFDGLVGDLQTETVYGLGNGPTLLNNLFNVGGGTISSLLEFTPDGQLSGKRINLSQPIDAFSSLDQCALFSGYGRVVIRSGSGAVYSVALPSGRVTALGIMPVGGHNGSESWAFWGVAEQFGGFTYLVYASGASIVRSRVPDGLTSIVEEFTNLSDMASLTVSVSRQRWYFHYEGNGQFGGSSETLGSCSATFEIKAGTSPARFVWSPIGKVQLLNQPFLATLTAMNASNGVATNFSASVDLEGFNLATGGSVQVVPGTLTNFVAGVWTGLITVRTPVPLLQLVAEDAGGAQGISGEFSVSPTNDLVLLGAAEPASVFAGESFSYGLTVTNVGPRDATVVLLTNFLPAQVAFVGVTTTQGSCSRVGNTVRCDLGTVAAGGNAFIRITALAPAIGGVLTNRATIVRAEVDPQLGNNSVTLLTTTELPTLSVNDVTFVEGNSGTNEMFFTVSLSGRSTNSILVSYTTANGTAVASGSQRDYLARSGSLTFAPGVTNLSVAVPVRGDVVFEADETFLLQIFSPSGATISDNEGVGTIVNDDTAPSVSISDVTVVEGNIGTTQAVLTVVLSQVVGVAVTVEYETSNGTAIAGADYVGSSGTLTFAANSIALTQSITIPVVGDLVAESNEFFYVSLLAVSNASVTDGQGLVTILTDDGPGFLDHFSWDALSSPQQPNAPFAVRIEARDFNGVLVSNYNGTAAFRAGIGTGTDSTIVISEIDPGNIDAVEFANVSGRTLDISGFQIAVYDPTSFPLPVVTFVVPAGNTLPAGGVFRLSEAGTAPGALPNFRSGGNISWVNSTTNNETAVLLRDSSGNIVDFFCAVDAFPNLVNNPVVIPTAAWSGRPVPASTDAARTYQRVGDLNHHTSADWVYALPNLGSINTNMAAVFTGGFKPVAMSPTNTITFTDGLWTGLVTARETATNAFLRIADTLGHVGDSASFDVRVVPATDVALLMTASQNPAALGSNCIFTLVVTNRGPMDATGVSVTNTLPASFQFVAATSSQGVVSATNRFVVASLGSIAANASAQVRITVRPTAAGLHTNTALASATSADPTLINNYATVVSTIWLDSDGDGIPDAWELANSLNPNDPTDALLDSDRDGQSNLDEFRAGTDPRDPTSVMHITRIDVVGNDVRLLFHGVPGHVYRLERQDGTNPELWTTVLVFQTGALPDVQIVDTGGAGRPTMMYRISLIR